MSRVPLEEPDQLRVGAAGVFWSLHGLSVGFGIPEENIKGMLATLKIPLLRFPGGTKSYASLYALEFLLFEMGLPEALRGVRTVMHHELAALVYANASKTAVLNRVRRLSWELGTQKKPFQSMTAKKAIASKRKRRIKP